MSRPGAFAANFHPDTLNRFRDLCKRQGRQYTKVLERLAEIYLQTNGEVLDVPSVPSVNSALTTDDQGSTPKSIKQILQRLEQVEQISKENEDSIRMIIDRLINLEKNT